MSANLSAIFYLISGVLFILALRGLSSPETSRQGNFFGVIGMVIAITVTFLSVGNFSTSFIYVILFMLIGGGIGAFWIVISVIQIIFLKSYFYLSLINLIPVVINLIAIKKLKNLIIKKLNEKGLTDKVIYLL